MTGGGAHGAPRGLAWYISESSDRLIRVVFVAAQVVADYLRNGGATSDWSEIHQRAADRLLALCEVNKATYIKLGQHIGALDYLLPEEYVKTLRVLQHAAPTDSFETVRGVIEQEFPGRTVEDLFEWLDPVPLASASLAQVHVGRMKGTGERVAVKVQHAGLVDVATADIYTVSALLYGVKAVIPEFDYTWLADEVRVNLPRELDFTQEAANCEAAGRQFAGRPDVVVPHVHRGLTTPRVLTMSFEEGVYANRVGDIRRMGLRPDRVATVLTEAFSTQIFVNGEVHCDPHPANVLVRPMPGSPSRPQIVLLDHGLYRRIPRELRLNYAKLWRAIIMGDESGIKLYSSSMGAGEMYQLWASMLTTRTWDKVLAASEDIDSLKVARDPEEIDASKYYAKMYAAEISTILRRIPRELLLILKTNDNLRSIDLALGCPVNNLVTTARYVQRAINEERAQAHPGVVSAVQGVVDAARLELRLASFGLFQAAINSVAWTLGLLGLWRARLRPRGDASESAGGAPMMMTQRAAPRCAPSRRRPRGTPAPPSWS